MSPAEIHRRDTSAETHGAADFTRADFTREAEMGFTHAELLKRLPSAVAPFGIEKQSELVYRLYHREQKVMLTLKPETRRSIAAIALPVTAVKLEFFGFSAACYEGFMRRYKRYLHKGGG